METPRIVRRSGRFARCMGPAVIAGGVALLAAGCGGEGESSAEMSSGGAGQASGAVTSRFDLANRCFALRSVGRDAFVAKRDGGYVADRSDADAATAFFMKPTDLGAYLFHDPDAQFLAAPAAPLPGSGVAAADEAGDAAEWAFELDEADGFRIAAGPDGQRLAVDPDSGELVVVDGDPGADGLFRFSPAHGCTEFPEAGLNAAGEPFRGTNDDGTVFGFADTHIHTMAFERLGGRVISGDPFHRFGITHALDDCVEEHGPQGTADFIGNFQREGSPAGTHATAGWPTFDAWPVHDTLSHQQTYYIWLKRAWMAGLRLIVNHLSADEALCLVVPLKDNTCNEMDSVRMQIERVHRLQDYIDAQNGGPGEGWFRIVESPEAARRVIENGKLAVVLGIESSKIFGCGEFLDSPECTREHIDNAIAEFHELGVRSVFPAHWFDNAISGPGLFGPSELVLNVFNKQETGHYYRVDECPAPEKGQGANLQSAGVFVEGDNPIADTINQTQALAVPTYPPGPHCNDLGLTGLGEYLIQRLMDHGMLIETDHTSVKAKERILELAETNDYPVISGHTGTGGITTPAQKERILDVGGLVSPFNTTAPMLIEDILALRELAGEEHFFGVGFASDAGGLASQAPPREDAGEDPLAYPFTSFGGGVTFERQRTGERVYDLNEDGVAHYGLYADLIADMQKHEGGDQALELMFRSAEAYLRMWERAQARAASD